MRDPSKDSSSFTGKVTIRGGRVLVFSYKHEDWELIRAGSRLIVLGWTKKDGRDPLQNLPNHIAILNLQN